MKKNNRFFNETAQDEKKLVRAAQRTEKMIASLKHYYTEINDICAAHEIKVRIDDVSVSYGRDGDVYMVMINAVQRFGEDQVEKFSVGFDLEKEHIAIWGKDHPSVPGTQGVMWSFPFSQFEAARRCIGKGLREGMTVSERLKLAALGSGINPPPPPPRPLLPPPG